MATLTARQQQERVNKIFKQRVRKLVQFTQLKLNQKIIQDTPVDTGALQGNWQTSFNRVKSQNMISRIGDAMMLAENVISQWDIGKKLYFVNSLDYAFNIEYGGGSPRKAPNGMLRVNLALRSKYASEFI